MTALADYARLEAQARYFDGKSARPREVFAGFGKRSLVIIGPNDAAIAHWPLASLRAVSGRGASEMTLVPELGSDERLVLDDPLMMDAIARVCPDLFRRPVNAQGLRYAGLWGLGSLLSIVVIVFYLIPLLATQLAPLIPYERERALGDAVANQVSLLLGAAGQDDDGICRGEEGLKALKAMTDRLQAHASLPYEIQVDVLDHSLVNAIAMPGGRIFLFRGLIDNAETPEEVAGVLAHEIGHIVHRDPTTGVLRTAGTAGMFSMILGDIFGAGIIAAAGEAALNASYQREAEARADDVALQILADAGLPSRPFAMFFIRLRERYGDTPRFLAYFASHPAMQDRADRAKAGDSVGGGAYTPVLDDRNWVAMRNICTGRDE